MSNATTTQEGTTQPTQALPDLSHHIGSQTLYRHPLARTVLYTEGMQDLAEQCGAHWFIDVIASHIATNASLRREKFQLWILKLDIDGGCRVEAWTDTPGSDGAERIVRQVIEYTDFPADFQCYATWDGQGFVIMLKSEY